MRGWNLAVILLSLTLQSPFSAAARAADSEQESQDNAAMKYWQAFALLPSLDKDQEALLEDCNQVPLDAAALKLIDKSQQSRQFLYRGTKLPRCDWSLDYKDGIFLVMPYLPKSRTLARLVALHARHEFEQGHWEGGWEDVTALLKLAHHLELEPLAVQHLVGFSIETVAIKAAVPYLPQLKAILPKAASAVVDALPGEPTPSQLVLKEKQIAAVWLIQALQEAEQRKEGSWHEVWKNVFGAPQEGGGSQDLVNAATTFEQAIKMLEDLLPCYDELAKLTTLPWREFDAQYPEFAKQVKAANPLASILISMDHAMASIRRNHAQRELFKAALAVVQSGPDKLKGFQDPYGDGPFEYRALDQGFELKSKLLVKGQHFALTAGNRK
jgi:hypothetical protein